MRRFSVTVEFGRQLAQHRLAARLTQQRLAELAGMDPAEISRYEKGSRSPRLDTVLRLARALGVSPGQLVDPDGASERAADIAAIAELLRGCPGDQVRRVREAIELLLTT